MSAQRPQAFPCGSAGKESGCSAEEQGSIPALERYPGEGKGYPLQYFGLENSMDCLVPSGCKESDMTEELSEGPGIGLLTFLPCIAMLGAD